MGKSYLIELFGRECFELLKGIKVEAGRDLLFLDEIQDCPQALKAMRYFAEEMPKLHVIAAGSLLEFVLEDNSFSFPVGRVQMMNLGPLTFKEYLRAKDLGALVNLLEGGEEITQEVHERLLEHVTEFMTVGGMPGVVSTYLLTNSYLEAERKLASILDLFTLDFGKYATRHAAHRHLTKLFEQVPNLVGKHFRYSKIDPESSNPARDYREALARLQQARLINQVHYTTGNGLPLRAEKSEKKFKIFFLDIGLLSTKSGSDQGDKEEISPLFWGIKAEQFVAQELLALQDPFIDRGLYYWENLNRGSSAEIDFLVNLNHKMVPIEVKSGSTGRLKSLRQFMMNKKVNLGVQISSAPFNLKGEILSIPFYMISELSRLL